MRIRPAHAFALVALLLAGLVFLLCAPLIWPGLTEPPRRGPAVCGGHKPTLRQALDLYSADG